jgi:hypothetical protein
MPTAGTLPGSTMPALGFTARVPREPLHSLPAITSPTCADGSCKADLGADTTVAKPAANAVCVGPSNKPPSKPHVVLLHDTLNHTFKYPNPVPVLPAARTGRAWWRCDRRHKQHMSSPPPRAHAWTPRSDPPSVSDYAQQQSALDILLRERTLQLNHYIHTQAKPSAPGRETFQ